MNKFALALFVVISLAACKKKKSTSTSNNSSNSPSPTTCASNILFGLELNANYLDTSCNSKNATGVNTTFVTDRNSNSSKAVSFNGTTSYISVPNDTLLHPAFPFTVSFWVNPADSSASGNHFFQSQIANAYYGFWIHTISGTGELAANFGNGTGTSSGNRNSAITTTRIRSNRWTHIAVVYLGYNNIQVYINGVAESSINYSGTATSIAYLPTSTSTALGRIGGYDGFTTSYYNGKMDKVKMWSRALSSTEINTEYSATN